VLILVGIAYLIIGSPLFKISELKIVNAETIDESVLLSTIKSQIASQPLGGFLGPDNYISWNNDIAYTSPLVTTITIEKSFWDRSVTITVSPRKRYAVWCSGSIMETNGNCRWIDEAGIAFEVAPIAEGQLVQTIFDNGSSSNPGIGNSVINTGSFEVVKKILDNIRHLDIRVTEIKLDRQKQELRVITSSNNYILFSIRFDPIPTALPALHRFLANPGLDKLQYINLTVENRAFIKTK